MFSALQIDQVEDRVVATVRELPEESLPEGDLTVDVLYSSLNYKDALAVTGTGKIIRSPLPFVPGIDLVGRVVSSAVGAFTAGDLVIQTGGGLGETRWGGYSRRQRLSDEWLVRLPSGLSPKHAMVLGTAGFTAMLAADALADHGVTPDRGAVVVSGASGGVGSLAVALLARRGYEVVASTGSPDAHAYLRSLGAVRFLARDDLGKGPARPLASARWAGAVDTVGGATLGAILSTLGWHGCVASCGNAGGHELHTTVFPFILRGVNLLGIDSNTAVLPQRRSAWKRLADELPPDVLDRVTAEVIPLGQVPVCAERLLRAGIRGRVVVDVARE